MILPVTQESGPQVLANDKRNKWRSLTDNGDYYQTDEKNGICLEIFLKRAGQWEWSLYDANSPDPDLAVTKSEEDKPTIEEIVTDLYDYVEGYEPYKPKRKKR